MRGIVRAVVDIARRTEKKNRDKVGAVLLFQLLREDARVIARIAVDLLARAGQMAGKGHDRADRPTVLCKGQNGKLGIGARKRSHKLLAACAEGADLAALDNVVAVEGDPLDRSASVENVHTVCKALVRKNDRIGGTAHTNVGICGIKALPHLGAMLGGCALVGVYHVNADRGGIHARIFLNAPGYNVVKLRIDLTGIDRNDGGIRAVILNDHRLGIQRLENVHRGIGTVDARHISAKRRRDITFIEGRSHIVLLFCLIFRMV